MSSGSGSSFPITRLAYKYNEMKNDGVVLSNRAAIDVVDTRIRQLLERIDVDEAPGRVAKIYSIWQKIKEKKEERKQAEVISLEDQLDKEFEKIYHDYQAWNQMFTALDLRGKMVEREVKILKEIRAVITAEDAYKMNAELLAAMIRVIGDNPKKMKQVQYEFTKIIGESSDRIEEGHGENDWGGGAESGGEEGSGYMDEEELLHSGNEERSEIEG
jgi:hypothetical protein